MWIRAGCGHRDRIMMGVGAGGPRFRSGCGREKEHRHSWNGCGRGNAQSMSAGMRK